MTNAIQRCPWLDESKADYVKYHDEEWGVPIYNDQKLFECLTLECSQAGLSWYTILKRRDGYRHAFHQFNISTVAAFNDDDIERLVLDKQIIRHRGKISATVNNAQCILDIQQTFGSFSEYLWSYVEHKVQVFSRESIDDYPATSALSDKLSKDLKKRGFKFVGSTTIYAFLQAVGIINEHSIDCFRNTEILAQYKNNDIKWIYAN